MLAPKPSEFMTRTFKVPSLTIFFTDAFDRVCLVSSIFCLSESRIEFLYVLVGVNKGNIPLSGTFWAGAVFGLMFAQAF